MVEWSGIPNRERDELIARLNLARRMDGDGRISFEGEPFFDDVVGVLEAALEFPDGLPETEARRAVSAALFAEGVETLDAESMRRGIEEQVGAFLGATPSPYMLVGSVSARYFGGLRETEIAGRRIAFHRQVPEAFRSGHRQAENRVRRLVPGKYGPTSFFPFRYAAVTVEAEGRSEIEAAARAQRALDAQRGIWNLALIGLAPATGGSSPLNHVLPGPVQSLHLPDGEVLHWPVWYEPEYVGPVGEFQARRLEQHWEEVGEYEQKCREGFSGSRYRPVVEDFVRDYARILDGRDPEATFVRLWGLLERLVGLGEREPHSEVTRRGAFLVRSDLRGLQYRVLEAMRRHRNAGVHEGILPSDARNLLRQLVRFVVGALEFHLDERFGFRDPEDAARFLSQPSEAGPLRQRIRSLEQQGRTDGLRLARMAMEYHGHEVDR